MASSHSQPDPLTDASRGQRLQKVLAAAGVASRRKCEQLIEHGAVTVNGRVVTALPAWVDPLQDRICVDGRPIPTPRHLNERAAAARRFYIAVHKPRRVISTTDDPHGRKPVTDLIDPAVLNPQGKPPRLYPVGRLDAESTGLILLTNDGELAHRLTHPSYEVPKQYEVSVRGQVTQADLQRLREGLFLAHTHSSQRQPKTRRARMAQVQVMHLQRDRTHGDRTTLRVTLREGQNRQIRRLLARLGHKVRRLKRVAIGPISLKGLAAGQWRRLTTAEVAQLKRAAGLHHRPSLPRT